MKYIRTKDGIYQSVFFKIGIDSETGEEYLTGKDTKIHTPNNKIINQSDTIEELCDEFVGVSKLNNDHFIITERLAIKKPDERITFSGGIYGAIWTEWGLKYVAKINEKGELELL